MHVLFRIPKPDAIKDNALLDSLFGFYSKSRAILSFSVSIVTFILIDFTVAIDTKKYFSFLTFNY